MAENVNNTIKTKVELDANQAQQEIVKLNSLASDGTQELEKRLDAKNKQIEVQNKLNQKAIADAQKLVSSLQGVVGKEKQYEKAVKTLNKAKLNEVKVNERNAKQQRKLSETYDDSKGALNKLNTATGGFIDSLKALAANPIVLVMTLLVGVFQLFKKAIARSEKATASFAKIGAFVSGVFNGFISILEPLVEMLGDTLVSAIEKPGEAWDGLIGILQSGFDIWKVQIFDRFVGNLKILSGSFQSGILKMRIAWNEFTGDSEEAKSLTDELEKVNEKIEEGYEAHRIANKQLVDGFNAAKDAVVKFAEKAKDNYDKAAEATMALAGAEKQLVVNQIALEKQQLTSLRLAEKQRQVRDDISKSFAERIAANKELGDVLDEQAKKELGIAQQNLNIARLKEKADGKNIESIQAIGDAELKILEIRERITGQRSEQLVNEQALIKEQTDKDKENAQKLADFKKGLLDGEKEDKLKQIEDEKTQRLLELEELKIDKETKAQLKLDIEAKYRDDNTALKLEKDAVDNEQQLALDEFELERLRGLGEAKLADELAFLEKQRTQELANKDLSEKQKALIDKKYNKKAKGLKDLEKKQSKDKDMAILESSLGAMGELFGASKELSIAGALINTYKGISEVWASKPESGFTGAGLVQKIATTAIVAAQGFKTVKNIVSTKAPKVKGGGGGGGGGGGSMPSASAPQIPKASTEEVTDLSSSNQARLGQDSQLASSSTQVASANVQAGSGGNVVFSENSYKNFREQVEFKENKTTI